MRNDQTMQKGLSLDLIGVQEGTDKNSLINDYLRHYEQLFSGMRHDEFNLIEIGVFHGGSTRMWQRFFSRARIIGVDVDPSCRKYAKDRMVIEIGSQSDPEFLHRLATTYPPRVVIDDGSHQSYDIIFTFERLFPALPPGGIYVIEDLHFHMMEDRAERLRAGSPILAHDYVANLIKGRLGGEAHVHRLEGIARYLVASIDRIEIVDKAAVFHKAMPAGDSMAKLMALRSHVEASKDWHNWLWFSQKLQNAGAAPADVVDGLRRSVALSGKIVLPYERLSEALERMRDIDGAVEVLEKAIVVAGGNAGQVASLRNRIQRLRGPRA